MHQPTFASGSSSRRSGRPAVRFLERIDSLVPWDELEGREPHVPAADAAHPLRPRYNLSGDGGSPLRSRVGAALLRPHPDRGHDAILHFRHLLERHDLNEAFVDLATGRACARARSWRQHSRRPPRPQRARPGDAPDEEGERVALRHAHIGVDAEAGAQHAGDGGERGRGGGVLHGEEREAYGDAGYRVEKRPEQARPEVRGGWRCGA